MKTIIYLALILISFSCGLKTHQEKVEQELKDKIEVQDKAVKKGKKEADKFIDSIHNSY